MPGGGANGGTAPNNVTATIGIGFDPFGLAVNPGGTRAYVTNTGAVVDTGRRRVPSTC